MHYKVTACGIAVAAAFASASAFAAPTVSWKQPYNGKTVSGTISGSSCEATGSNIRYVRFYVDNVQLSIDGGSPWNCSIDTRKYSNGTHALRVQAHDNSGASSSQTVNINVQNGSTTPPPPTSGTGPSVSWTAPASGGTLTGNIQQSTSQCQVSGTGVARMVFFMDSTQLNTELTAPYLCNVDTTKFANGTHTLKAVAYNTSGAATTITRSVSIQNGTSSGGTSGAPTVAITSPAAGATISGDLNCAASASDTGGSITRVDFLIDNKNVASDSGAP